ncbi:hypothetical protein PRIPAC_86737 [Pristionchus pacificus]|uniref:G protein-coupled receptor n=1 Tax=Pristionchus pacificus TaxID=54126 RepID=A0A2A6BTC2_PRIPA|nr:hypothetical protein PRIPAC_86737 [Pristionchus pacificus]|eukprot:PDM69232.1 G protein-coupled receptor [Pristionchus pacificus]
MTMNISTAFAGDDGFVLFHAIFSYLLFVLSLFLNVIVFALVRISRKIDGFRYVFYTYCVANTIYATSFPITLTQWYNGKGFVVFFPTGPFAEVNGLIRIVFRIQTLAYIFVMSLVCATFIYRYLLVTRPTANGLIAKALSSISFFPVTLWLVDNSLIMLPDENLRERINNELGNRFLLNFNTIHMFAIENKRTDRDVLQIIGSILTVLQINLMVIIMIWAGLRIYQKIQTSGRSNRSKMNERHAFRLLLSQAINPIVVLHTPSFLNFLQSEFVDMPEAVDKCSCLLMNVFTVTNPLLNILLSKDLRNSLSRRKKSSISMAQI